MAHLVPMSPPKDYHVPSMTSFSVSSPDGVGQILAWGANIPGWNWRVGTDTEDQVVSTEKPSPYPDLKLFELRGARQGLKLALFVNQGAGWKRYSEYVNVDSNIADIYAADFLAGTLPKSKHSKHISFYPFGAQQAYQSMTETEWMDKVEDALGKLSKNVIGRTVLRNVYKDVTIYPHLPSHKNAWADIRINPKQWDGDLRPGASVDEILLHELIHVIENNAAVYQDRWGFMFDSTDFLTVNATNVYSCMLGRALRKDHHDFMHLPDEHFRNPRLHWEQQEPNYMLAGGTAGNLVGTLATVQGVWNPFFYWAERFRSLIPGSSFWKK
jgi:hypothetical protein